MVKALTNSCAGVSPVKSKGMVYLEYALLVFCLGVICLRGIFTEGPAVQSGSLPGNIGDNLYSLSVSACLFSAFIIWIILGLCRKNFVYRITGMEIGLCVFCLAAVVSGFAAADKRQAITNIVVLISPLLLAVLMVQLLDTPAKIKLVLAVIAALGVLSAYQGFEQLFTTNQATIEQYQQNPQGLLTQFGIEPNSLEQFLFEHRLYSKNVSAFFTTRNSAGSFFLICFFASCALLFEKYRNLKNNPSTLLHFLGCLIPAAAILLCLFLTRSKGAIIGFVLAAGLLILQFRFADYLTKHRRFIIIFITVAVLVVIIFIAGFGLKYGSLPGGNSMLVRWQYWQTSAKIFAEHPLAGVGPGNFSYFYQRYKPAAAMESVADPHNFPLSLLVQYGPLGLIGFLLMIFIPLCRNQDTRLKTQDTRLKTQDARLKTQDPDSGIKTQNSVFYVLCSVFLILWVCLLLAQRMMVISTADAGVLDVLLYIIIRFYIPSVIAFTAGFLLLSKPSDSVSPAAGGMKEATFIASAIFCALLGVLLHNLTDFAIFEPGVYTIFWTVIACLIAINSSFTPRPSSFVYCPSFFVKFSAVTVALLISMSFLVYALVPVARSTAAIKQANQAVSLGRYEQAHSLLDLAAGQDELASVALSLDARLYLNQSGLQPIDAQKLLLQAQKLLETAAKRNNADYKIFERLTEIYSLLSDSSAGQAKNDRLNDAFTAASQAIECYPGCGRLQFSLAQIADKLGKTDIAIEHYSRAIEIEQQYRDQFRTMYPDVKEVISRLGEDKFQFATERIKELKKQ